MAPEQEIVERARDIERELTAIRQILRKPLETEIAQGDLTGPQRSVMEALVHSGGLSVKQLSRSVGLSHSTVSGIVDRLEARGLVRRTANAADRRLSIITITRTVREYLQTGLPAPRLSPIVQALSGASPAQQTSIVDALRTLHNLLTNCE